MILTSIFIFMDPSQRPPVDFSYQFSSEHALGGMRHLRGALGVHQQQRVVVLAKRGRADVAHQQRHPLARALGTGVGQQVVAFGRKADTVNPASLSAQTGLSAR
jgi:hypothetical protein